MYLGKRQDITHGTIFRIININIHITKGINYQKKKIHIPGQELGIIVGHIRENIIDYHQQLDLGIEVGHIFIKIQC